MPTTTQFADLLLEWHKTIDRKLPWKEDRDPYKIWLSEIIMQQTRVAQGTPYYLKFVEAFADITELANAPETQIMKLWQGLGYYSRARNLHHAAKTVRDEFDGQFPRDYNDILSLKGIGKYTAAAIASFAYGQEYPVVDGNVIRVLSRYFGITDAVDDRTTLKKINSIAEKMIKGSDPAAYNQAIMDFGAMHCKPKSPLCSSCVFGAECKAIKEDLVSVIPLKAKKIKKRSRHLHYFILSDTEDKTVLRFRTEKDIWQSLYDFPCLENNSDKSLSEKEIIKHLKESLNIDVRSIKFPNQVIKHILTHQTIFGQFYKVVAGNIPNLENPFLTIRHKNLQEYALPVLLTKYLRVKESPSLF